MLTRRQFLALSGAVALVPQVGFAAPGTVTVGGPAFGSYWRLTVADGSEGPTARALIEGVIEHINRVFSPYRADSEVSTFNRVDTRDWLSASGDFRLVLGHALEIARQSSGAFDPTIGPLVSRFGFGPIEAPVWGAFDQIEVGPDGARKDDAGLSLDLCGIAKGHALSAMIVGLENRGLSDFLLDLGGEVAARGSHPAGRSWQVAVEEQVGRLALGVRLEGRAIATSGVGAQRYGRPGSEVSHIIDPLMQSPVSGATVSVSVLDEDAARADGWATGLMAMPFERAVETAWAHDLDALLLVRDGEIAQPIMTGNFADHLLV